MVLPGPAPHPPPYAGAPRHATTRPSIISFLRLCSYTAGARAMEGWPAVRCPTLPADMDMWGFHSRLQAAPDHAAAEWP